VARQALLETQTALIVEMLEQNTALTAQVKSLTEHVEALTLDVHRRVVAA
jgi:ribosomal protein S15P/S13E